MHVVQAPCVGRIAADRRGALERRTFFGTVVWPALEIRLTAAQLVAKGGCGRSACAAGIFPLRFGRQPELPTRRKLARGASQLCKFLTESLGLGEVDGVHRVIVALASRELAGKHADDTSPLRLGDFVFADPKSFGERYLDL